MPNNIEKPYHWIIENKILFLLQGVLATFIFYADLKIELGVAAGVPYICLVLVSLWSKKRRMIWIAAVSGTVLTLIGYWLSPLGGEDWKVLTNRLLAIFAIWATAFIGYLFKKNEIALQQINENLEAQVETRTHQLKSTNENLQRMNEELKGFAHIVSHDLKEPLRGISYTVKWLVEDYGEKLGEGGKKLAGLLTQNTQRMHNLINGILEFAELGVMNTKPTILQSGEVAGTVIKYLTREPGIKIKIQEPMPKLAYHNLQLEQIFQNLVGNAIRHLGKPEGEIVISCTDQIKDWCFQVWDNGKGIESKHFERIFGMFQSLDRNNAPESTGIGLTLVRKIVEQNGGKVWVESEVDKFTCFKFTIPKIIQ